MLKEEWKKAYGLVKAYCGKQKVKVLKELRTAERYGMEFECKGIVTNYKDQLVVRAVFKDSGYVIEFKI